MTASGATRRSGLSRRARRINCRWSLTRRMGEFRLSPRRGRSGRLRERPKGAVSSRALRRHFDLVFGRQNLDPYVRCITRGLPNMMVPIGYNNGVQIVQGPGKVVVTKEIIHEARVISLERNTDLGPKLTQWLGDSRGRWEGDTLVVEVSNLSGQVDFRGASKNLRLVERYRRVDPETIEYRVTIDNPSTWTKPWTISLSMKKDDEQYKLSGPPVTRGTTAL